MSKSATYNPAAKSIILFDGVCTLCNGYVNFIIKRVNKDKVRFGTLQSESGQELLENNGMNVNDMDTVVLIQDGKTFTKSDVALQLAKNMNGVWKLFRIFSIVPKFIRDGVYDVISKNRYRWFGKQDACMIPTPELKKMFLD